MFDIDGSHIERLAVADLPNRENLSLDFYDRI